MSKRLRILHVVVQPVLVWDDGDEMTAGPPIEPQVLPLSAVAGFIDALPVEVANVQAQIEGPPIDAEPSPNGSEPVTA